MSAATPKAPPTKPKKDREREKKEKPLLVAERLKTVVRRLPPNLPEGIFWGSVAKWVTNETASWKVFYPGKAGNRLNKENIPSRAYIAFKTEEQVSLFSREYDGHTFRDKAGNESHAIVEFAPYQKVPPEKRKPDARNATIEKDEDYISFLALLEATANSEPKSLEALIAASQPPPQPTTTPLLEALKAEKSAMKDKEAILRNHAHHKETTILIPNRKEDGKKKAAPPPKPEPASIGKKGMKKGAQLPPQKSQAVNTSSKGNTNASGSSNAAPPKSPKKNKGAPQPMKIMQAPSKLAPAPAPAENPSKPPLLPAAAVPPPSQPTTAPAAAGPPRRRPVIGLASRHFEAALSGAGVNAAPSAGRRPSRRNPDQDADHITAKPGSTPGDAKPSPPSPRRDRGAKHNKDVAGPATDSHAGLKALNTLPRIDDAPAHGEGAEAGGSGAYHGKGAPNQSGAPPSRGARRARARARGGSQPSMRSG